MSGSESEVISAYNAFVEEQKRIAKEKNQSIKTTLILFDHGYEVVYSKVAVEETPVLTSQQYYVRGMTAYFDALGKAITSFEGKKRVIFFIETDGQENSSKEFNTASIKALVEQKKSEGWDFNFVGADLSSAKTTALASTLGIAPNKTMAFSKTGQGYATRNIVFSTTLHDYVDSTS